MLTIPVMATFGLWSILGITKLPGPRKQLPACERDGCPAKHIRYLFHCKHHNDERVWNIGSECGPNVVMVSEEIWNEAVKEPQKYLLLLERLKRLESLEADPHEALYHHAPWVPQAIERLSTPGAKLDYYELRPIQNRIRLAEYHHGLKRKKGERQPNWREIVLTEEQMAELGDDPPDEGDSEQ